MSDGRPSFLVGRKINRGIHVLQLLSAELVPIPSNIRGVLGVRVHVHGQIASDSRRARCIVSAR